MSEIKEFLKKRHRLAVILFILGCCLLVGVNAAQAQAASDTPIYYQGRTIGYYNDAGQIEYVPSPDGNLNYKALTYLITGNKQKTIIIPSGASIYINGPLKPGSNTTIIAQGATITVKKKSNAIFTEPNRKITNLSIIGGTWRSADAGGRTGSLFVFAHASNVMMDGVDCNANYKGHTIEIIACSNVTIQNCVVSAIGSCPAKCLEEQIQVDIATKKTAPKIASYGKKYVKGQTCKNIYILNNQVSGARAVGVNWTSSEKGKWRGKYHKNIVISGNTLTSSTSEGLAYFNVIGGKITNNTIITYAKRKDSNSSYTIGVHVAVFGKAPKSLAKSKLEISNNTIKGRRNGIYLKGYFNKKETKCLAKLGKVYVKNNQIYCKKGKKNSVKQTKKSCKKLKKSGNKYYKW